MLQPRIAPSLWRTAARNPLSACLYCQQHVAAPLFPPRIPIRTFSCAQPLRLSPASTPRSSEEPNEEEEFVPKPLGRPIGFKYPPQPGQNTGTQAAKKDYSNMSISERNLAKRADLVEKWGTNYFRDFKNIRKYRSGKTFMANKAIFKREAALYFPNFRGQTLAAEVADTTDVLNGKVSVVNVYSSVWGENQVRSFTAKKNNPKLAELLEQNRGLVQQVEINIEENTLKAWIIKIFMYQQRLKWRKEDWGKYFVVRKGVDQRIRETIGLLNGRVGYVYLLDQQCRIRWAGSANAEGTEVEDLTRGFQRLIAEARQSPGSIKSAEKGATRAKEEEHDSAAKQPVPV